MTEINASTIVDLMKTYADAKERAEAAKHTMEELKKILYVHAKNAGGYLAADGIGDARVMPETLTVAYDTKLIDEIVHELIQAGQSETAQKISNARRSSRRKSYLRIVVSNDSTEIAGETE